MKAGAVFVAAALWSGSGHACYTPPSHQLMGVNEQIAQATDVSLATVAGAALLENGKVRYDFVVRKRLIGPTGRTSAWQCAPIRHRKVAGYPKTTATRLSGSGAADA